MPRRAHGMLRNARGTEWDLGKSGAAPTSSWQPRNALLRQRPGAHVTAELPEEDEESTPAATPATPNQRPNTSRDQDDDSSGSNASGGDFNVDPRASDWQEDPLALQSTSASKLRSKWGITNQIGAIRSLASISPPWRRSGELGQTSGSTSPRPSPREGRTALRDEVMLKQNSTWPRHWVKRPTAIFSDGTIVYFEDNAGRLLGCERGKMVLTAASSAWCTDEDCRFFVREGSGSDLCWYFEAETNEQRAAWVAEISSHVHECQKELGPESHATANPDCKEKLKKLPELCESTRSLQKASSHDASVLREFEQESRDWMDRKTSRVLFANIGPITAKASHQDRPLSDSLREGILSAARFNRLIDGNAEAPSRPVSAPLTCSTGGSTSAKSPAKPSRDSDLRSRVTPSARSG